MFILVNSGLAEEGVPEKFNDNRESLTETGSEPLLQGEYKDHRFLDKNASGISQDQGPLTGRADMNVDSPPVMPPFAPPIQTPLQLHPRSALQNPSLAPISKKPESEQKSKFGSAIRGIFDLGANKNGALVERPNWIPAHAYTNDSMVAPYHNRDMLWWDKSPMPDRPQWVILSTSVTKYWRGFVPDPQSAGPCWVLVSPNPLAPGNFTFRARVGNGPRGWLQAIPRKSRYGFPLYRYWLDQP